MNLPVEDVIALQDLAARYWALADLTEQVPLDDLFEDQAVFDLGKLKLEGLPAIAAFFTDRAQSMRETGRTTRHLASNFLALPQADGSVRVRSTVIVHAGNGEHPLPAAEPSGIADFHDVCRRQPDGRWLYHHRSASTVFVGAGAAAFAR
ncbi:MAG: nuclear transport factor 2 family protein [Alteraurantiacibacter sp.]